MFQGKPSQQFYLYYIYSYIYEHVTQPLPLNLLFVNKTQDIIKSNHFYCHITTAQAQVQKKITYGQYVFTDCTEDNVQNTHTYTQYTQCTIKTYRQIQEVFKKVLIFQVFRKRFVICERNRHDRVSVCHKAHPVMQSLRKFKKCHRKKPYVSLGCEMLLALVCLTTDCVILGWYVLE